MRRLWIAPSNSTPPADAGPPHGAPPRPAVDPWRHRAMRSVVLAVLAAALLAAATPSWAKEGRKVSVSIKSLKYAPATVQVEPGDTVIWTNDDDRGHTVVAEEGAFRSGEIAAGKTFRHTFGEPGKFKYHCDHHPRMKGTVIVKAGK